MVVNSTLPYPEGRAAAEILKVGSDLRKEANTSGHKRTAQASGMKDIVSGTALAGFISLCANGFHETPWPFWRRCE